MPTAKMEFVLEDSELRTGNEVLLIVQNTINYKDTIKLQDYVQQFLPKEEVLALKMRNPDEALTKGVCGGL